MNSGIDPILSQFFSHVKTLLIIIPKVFTLYILDPFLSQNLENAGQIIIFIFLDSSKT